MPYPVPRGSPRAVLAVATLVASLVVACDRSVPTAPSGRAPLPAAPSADLDPTGDPNVGCWVAPNPSVFGGSTLYGGIFPYEDTRCGVRMSVWWPGDASGVWPYTAVFWGDNSYNFPWGHRPGWCCVPPPEQGFPWTITFDKPVRNVRVYTRSVEYPGGVVRVKGRFGGLIAEKPIPIRPGGLDAGRDTISFADTNVYIIEIVPDRHPDYPADASYPDRREAIGWQAQFEPPPPPPLCILDAGADSVHAKAFNDSTVRREMENMLARSDTSAAFANRHEEVAFVYRNADGTYRVEPASFSVLNQCQSSFIVPLDPTLVAVIHTHPFHEGQTPGCPGAETKKYEPTLNGGGSDGDFVSKLSTNFNRQLQLGGYQIPYYIMDLDRAWFNPPQSLQGEAGNKSINRAGNASCRWI